MNWRYRLADLALTPAVLIAAIPMRLARAAGVERLPGTRWALRSTGVFPVRNHYYEPLVDTSQLAQLNSARDLPGLDFRVDAQVQLLKLFGDDEGLQNFDRPVTDREFSINNPNFGAGDAELWFHVIRHFKPRRIIEIGSGNSTKIAQLAISRNHLEDHSYQCEHICVEPFEMPWLEATGATIMRERVENIDKAIFTTLEPNDILFIDSSHIIRPQGDVLTEYLEIVPRLQKGVIVHVHDIFSPRDYPESWIKDRMLFWNEQYLLEAFLSFNATFEILLAANLLKHDHYDALKEKCIYLSQTSEPGSLYIRRAS